MPVVCLCAGLLLAATHTVSGGNEIRRSDAPRLVDLVRDAQQSVDRLAGERDAMVSQIDNHHGGSPGVDAALVAITHRADVLAADAGLDPMRGPGLVVTLDDAQRDAEGRFPGDASPDDLVVHQQDIQAVLNALWSRGRRRHPDAGSADHRHVRAAVRRQHAAAQRAHLQSRRTSSPRSATSRRCRRRWPRLPLVTLYKQYVVRFGLGYTEEPRDSVELVGYPAPVRMRYAKPAGPLGY